MRALRVSPYDHSKREGTPMFKRTLIAACLLASPVYAATIWDTGSTPLTVGGIALDPNEYVGVFLGFGADVSISDIETEILPSGKGDHFQIKVYATDDRVIPGTQVYSGRVDVASSGPGFSWQGVHNINLNLSAGDYFFTFEVENGNPFEGGIGYQVPNPLSTGIYTVLSQNDGWHYGQGDMSFRLSGAGGGTLINGVPLPPSDPGGIPEPGTWALMITGFGAIGISMRRRYQYQAQA